MNKTIAPNISYQPYINADGMEEVRYIDPTFPIELWTADFENLAHNKLGPHWHDAFEFALILRGQAVYDFGTQSIILSPGDALFVNSASPHGTAPMDQDLTMFTVAFSPSLFGFPGDVLYEDVITPFLNGDFSAVVLSDQRIVDKLHRLYEYAKSPALSYMHLVVEVVELWELFLDTLQDSSTRVINRIQARNTEQIKHCVSFIRKHWQEKITVEDLARSASISKNTCYRLFRQYFHESPTSFINKFRINNAELLLLNTKQSVQDIAFSCGFNSVVYFDRLFHQIHGVTPLQYRHSNKSAKE